jgi:hypothetical protein
MVRTLWAAVIALTIFGVASGSLRTLILMRFVRSERIIKWAVDNFGDRDPRINAIDLRPIERRYEKQRVLMLLHALAGSLFLILAPLQMVSSFRSRRPQFHRWNGGVVLVSGLVTGLSAVTMPFRFALISGGSEVAAVLLYGGWFLWSLGIAYYRISRRQIDAHRLWMIRAYAMGLAAAADRPAVWFFLAFTRMPVREFFGMALWTCFGIFAVVAEAWIRYPRMKSHYISNRFQGESSEVAQHPPSAHAAFPAASAPSPPQISKHPFLAWTKDKFRMIHAGRRTLRLFQRRRPILQGLRLPPVKPTILPAFS